MRVTAAVVACREPVQFNRRAQLITGEQVARAGDTNGEQFAACEYEQIEAYIPLNGALNN